MYPIDPDLQRAVKHLVTCVVEAASCVGEAERPALRRAVAELALWGWLRANLPLDPSVLFESAVLTSFCAALRRHRLPVATTARLLHDATSCAGQDVMSGMPILSTTSVNGPYSSADTFAIVNWARWQKNPDRRDNASVLVSLALGAGLTAHEIIAARAGDLRFGVDGVEVVVRSSPPRIVPIHASLVGIFPASRALDSGAFLFRTGRRHEYPNAISNFIERCSPVGSAPQPRRMRATWIARRIQAGVPLDAVATAAGIRNDSALRHMIPPSPLESPMSVLRALRDDVPPSDVVDSLSV